MFLNVFIFQADVQCTQFGRKTVPAHARSLAGEAAVAVNSFWYVEHSVERSDHIEDAG